MKKEEYDNFIKELEKMMEDTKKEMALMSFKRNLVEKKQIYNLFNSYLSSTIYKTAFIFLLMSSFSSVSLGAIPTIPLFLFCGNAFLTFYEQAKINAEYDLFEMYKSTTNANTESEKKQHEIELATKYEIAKNNYESLKRTLDCLKAKNSDNKSKLLENQNDIIMDKRLFEEKQKELEILCKQKVLNDYYRKQEKPKILKHLFIVQGIAITALTSYAIAVTLPLIGTIATLGTVFAASEAIIWGVAIKNKKDENIALEKVNQELGENAISTNPHDLAPVNKLLNKRIDDKINELCKCRLSIINNTNSSNSNEQNSELEKSNTSQNKYDERLDKLLEQELKREEQRQKREKPKIRELTNPYSSNY